MNTHDLILYVVPAVAAILSWILARWLKVSIEVDKLLPIIVAFIEAFAKVETQTADGKPKNVFDFDTYRAELAANIIETKIPDKVSTIKKWFGGTVSAVKYLFPILKPIVQLIHK